MKHEGTLLLMPVHKIALVTQSLKLITSQYYLNLLVISTLISQLILPIRFIRRKLQSQKFLGSKAQARTGCILQCFN